MARGRMLNKKISKSIQFNALPDDTCRLLATWIIAHLDKNGVYTAEPVLVKSEIFPWRSDVSYEQVEYYLDAMEANGLITRFKARGQRWQYWPGFVSNQIGLRQDREETDCPEPPRFDVPPDPEPPQPPAEGQNSAGELPDINEDDAGSNPANSRNEAGSNPAQIPPNLKGSLNRSLIPNGIGADAPPDPSKEPDEEGESSEEKALGPRKQLMSAFQTVTNLKFPHRQSDQDFWWSNIGEIYEIACRDVDIGKQLIQETVAYMRQKRLTISGPQSVVNICRSLASGQELNQEGRANGQRREHRTNGKANSQQFSPGQPPPGFTPETWARIVAVDRKD